MTKALDLDTVSDADAKHWLVYKRATGTAPKTLDLYAIVVRQLIGFFNKPLASVTKLDAIAWLEDAKTNWQPGGIASRLKAIRAFYNFLVAEEIITKSPFKGITMKVPNVAQPTCSDDQLAKMLAGATRQESALILTLSELGIRKDECANIELADVDIAHGTVRIRISKSEARTLTMSDKLVVAMSRWIRERGTDEGSLWVPLREAADNYSMIRSTLNRRSGGTVTPHSLRRKFCVEWLLAGHSETALARRMGWADTTQVATYTKAAADLIAASEYRKFKSVA